MCCHRMLSALLLTSATAAPLTYQPPVITVPPGFSIELVAAPPLVGHPMMACFDERGRLFIAESAGFNLDEKQLEERRPNFIRMIEDTDGDGVFDKSVIFADKLMIPNGALWLDGALYVAEPPGIWRFIDTDGDGVADRREHLAGNVRSNGMSSTLHGPVLHPGGRLFWCSGQQGYSLEKDAEPPPGRIAPGVFSLTRDGAEHEVFAIGGTANPVEVTFNDEGEVFGTIAILDRVDGQRNDALMHWIYGGIYSHNPNDPVPLKRTGPDLPPLSRVGQVAPAGLECYRGASFGAEFRGNIFWSQFNTRRVLRTRIERDGATFRSKDEDFLVSESVDFHPTDVIEDADGSLLVIDTGGWFRHGCPTSHIAKPEAKGAIYRIRRTDARKIDDPRGLKLDWTGANVVTLLDDPRPAVRDRAIATLAQQGDRALDALKSPAPTIMARRNAVWTLSRIGTTAARKMIRDSLKDADASVRQAAANALGCARDRDSVSALIERLERDAEPSVRREAATALGRIGDGIAVAPLLAALRKSGDTFLDHSLIYALIQIGQPDLTRAGLSDSATRVRRGALLALSQMKNAGINRDQLAPLLRADAVELQRAAFSVAARDDMVSAMREQLTGTIPAPRATLFEETLAAQAGVRAVQQLIVDVLRDPQTAPPTRLLVIDAIQHSTVKPFPDAWIDPLAAELHASVSEVRLAVVALARARALKPLDGPLTKIAADAQQPAPFRLACLDAIAPRLGTVDDALFTLVDDQLAAADTPTGRLSAARTLAALRLSKPQILRLVKRLPSADALILPTLLQAFTRAANDEVGQALVAALEKAPAITSTRADDLARLLEEYPAATQSAAKPLLALLGANLERQRARLEELSPLLNGGDVGRGKQVFFDQKATCVACHRVSGQGGVIGPNLSTIAEVRSGRDLLESVVFPSASIVQSYHPFNVGTRDGQSHFGMLIRETPEAVWLRAVDLTEVKIETAQIATMAEAPISLMPQGLDAILSADELRDLLAFLQSLKTIRSSAPER